MKDFLFILLLIPFAISAQIGAKAQQKESIHGVWQNNQFGYQMTLMLNADGTGEFDGDMILFTAQANKLAITLNGVITNYTYALQGNSLTLNGGDLDKPVIFSRNGTTNTQPTTANATPTPKMGGVNGNVPLNTPVSNELIGLWSGMVRQLSLRPMVIAFT